MNNNEKNTADDKISFVAEINDEINSKYGLLNAISVALNFPSYFGFNWDSLDECLNDLSWIKEKRIIIKHKYAPKMSEQEMKKYTEILQDCSKSWKGSEIHEIYFEFTEKT